MAKALLCGALAAGHTPFAPSLPSVYEELIEWDQELGGKTYHYTHKRSYDLANQLYRDDQMDGADIVTSTVYRPNEGWAYQKGSNSPCVTWQFTSHIDGFPPVAGFAYNLTDKVGDEYSHTYYDPTGKEELYRLDVWFSGSAPVQYHSTDDEARGVIVGGIKKVTNYVDKIVDKDRFTIPKEWGCEKEVAVEQLLVAGGCTADDATKVNSQQFTCDAVACAKANFFKSSGTAACVQKKDDISPSCAACFGDITACALKHCALQCLANPLAAKCQACGHAACDAEAHTCTGLTTLPPDASTCPPKAVNVLV